MTIPRFGISLFVCAWLLASMLSSQTKFYVANNGNDRWSGALPAPDVSRTDGPFATLGRAAAAVAELQHGPAKRAHGNAAAPDRPVSVEVRGGTYDLRSSLVLTNLSHVDWRPYRSEKVTITGGTALPAYLALRDPAIRALIRPALRDSIVEIDLKANGIADAGDILPRGGPALQLFLGGREMPLVRYPKEGWLHIADVPQSGDSLYNKGLDRERRFNNVPVGRHYGRITYDTERPGEWSGLNEMYMQGYWTWDWSDSFQKVKQLHPDKHEIEIREPHHWYGYTRNQRYCFFNVLEELTVPGEWCINRASGKLYFYPPSPMALRTAGAAGDGELRASVLADPMIIMDSCRDVSVEGFTIVESRGKGIVIRGGANCRVSRCELAHLGDCAVVIERGMHNGISGCTLHDLALGAVLLGGGDRESLTPAGNFAENNHIHHFSQWLRTGQYAVNMTGVGNRIAHNLIHDAPFEAIYLSGNDHIVEFNEVHHVTQESGDAGALHTGRDWTWRGNIIRYNYFHHLQGNGLHGVMGVYLDDWASGFTVTGNVFYKAGRATLIGGGRDNIVENNVYVECSPSIHVDARGLGWASYYFTGAERDLFKKMDAMKYSQPPFSTRYPELLTIYTDDPALPKHNIIRNNVSFGGRFMDVYDYHAFDFSIVDVSNNVIADSAVMRRRDAGLTGWDPYYLNIDYTEGYHTYTNRDSSIRAELRGNVFPDRTPFAADGPEGRFTVKKEFRTAIAGFRDIPFEHIGLLPKE